MAAAATALPTIGESPSLGTMFEVNSLPVKALTGREGAVTGLEGALTDTGL